VIGPYSCCLHSYQDQDTCNSNPAHTDWSHDEDLLWDLKLQSRLSFGLVPFSVASRAWLLFILLNTGSSFFGYKMVAKSLWDCKLPQYG
jgi:hypothetical protein